jgi:hypothetical protein
MDLASMASANSFVPGTEVVMADGSRKPIEQVEVGDEVLATDPTTGKTSKQKVTDTIEGKGEKKLVKLTVDTDGDKGEATDTITATAGHPFWVPAEEGHSRGRGLPHDESEGADAVTELIDGEAGDVLAGRSAGGTAAGIPRVSTQAGPSLESAVQRP